MCLITFASQASWEYPLVLVANRDESYQRPTQAAHFWKTEGYPHILAGKDLLGGGTWLGINIWGQWAALTNYRDWTALKENAPSRGALTLDFLKTKQSAYAYLQEMQNLAQNYNGFNLLVGDTTGIYHYSNVTDEIVQVPHGIHGLSNALLDTSWPKLTKAKQFLEKQLQQNNHPLTDIFPLMMDSTPAKDSQLPSTGLPLALERAMSSIFITTPDYGTRCTTLLVIDRNHKASFIERQFSPNDRSPLEEKLVEINLVL